MKIIIGHYHLNPGGVTRVIQSQLNGLSLSSNLDTLVVCDGQGLDNIVLPDRSLFVCSELLGYAPSLSDHAVLFEAVRGILLFFKQIADREDVIHFHNIGLGKNAALTYAMFLLAKQGYNIVNHAHDFAEDRPANMTYLTEALGLLGVEDIGKVLYPAFDNYHFGTLNSFDKGRLQALGVVEDRLHLWPNPVSAPKSLLDKTKPEAKLRVEKQLGFAPGKRLVLYPVRVIRRKNIGEFILLAALFSDRANFVVTLPPLNPVEIEAYNKWVAFCVEHKINLCFDAAYKADFEWLMKGADVCFTTSVMEGFGMVFVEPWLWGTPVAGREIATVFPDFEAMGLQYPFIYKRIGVPCKGDECDFADLSVEEQKTSILSIMKEGKRDFVNKNRSLADFFAAGDIHFENNNKEIISHELSEKQYGKRLYKFYKTFS